MCRISNIVAVVTRVLITFRAKVDPMIICSQFVERCRILLHHWRQQDNERLGGAFSVMGACFSVVSAWQQA